MNKSRKKVSFLSDTRGMSMVTVIVAFVVLLLLIAMFTQVVRLSQNLIAGADSRKALNSELLEKYYTNDISLNSDKLTPDNHYFKLSDGKTSFNLKSPIYKYSDGNANIYSFGAHTVPSVDDGGAK